MPTYAVKIGEVMLRSEKPITETQRKRATEILTKAGYRIVPDTDLEVVLAVYGH